MPNFIQDPALSTEDIARRLLGQYLVCQTEAGTCLGWIVETEAYLGVKDRAAHVYGGRRTSSLDAFYHEAGTIYIFSSHGHLCMNIITQGPDEPQGCLLRALQPDRGQEIMAERRHGKRGYELTNGPGKLSQAMGIDKERDYGTSIFQPPLFIDFSQARLPREIGVSPRIGIPGKGQWTDKPLRFFVRGNGYVSRRKGKIDADQGWQEGGL